MPRVNPSHMANENRLANLIPRPLENSLYTGIARSPVWLEACLVAHGTVSALLHLHHLNFFQRFESMAPDASRMRSPSASKNDERKKMVAILKLIERRGLAG